MAIAERLLAARFGDGLVDHRTWVIASDGDLMEGISHEAASLAGHLRLGKLTVLYDDNGISIDGETSLALSDDALQRFESYGWSARRVDGHDPAEVATALAAAVGSDRPTLIACRTIIGFAAPKKAGTAASHGAPLGAEEAAAAKSALGWNHPRLRGSGRAARRLGKGGPRRGAEREAWLRRLGEHPQRAEFERAMAGRLPDGGTKRWSRFAPSWRRTGPSSPPALRASARWKPWSRRCRRWWAARRTSPVPTTPM